MFKTRNVTAEIFSTIMYKDPSILLGYVNTDTAVQFAADKPTVAVMPGRDDTTSLRTIDALVAEVLPRFSPT